MVQDSKARHELLALADSESQTELELKCGVPQPQISLILALKRLPGLETALKFVKLGIQPKDWKERPTKAQLAAERVRRRGAA